VFSRPRAELQKAWTEVSWRIARLRDNPEAADAEFARATDAEDRGLSMSLTFDPAEDVAAPMIAAGHRPREVGWCVTFLGNEPEPDQSTS